MKKNDPVNIFWFRRDLRLNDNVGLEAALKSDKPVLPIFIFDAEILQELPKNDARVSFIYQLLQEINGQLRAKKSGLKVYIGKPLEVWRSIVKEYKVEHVFFNHDYEPYALQRDREVSDFLVSENISISTFKDHVFFERDEILKADGTPYTVYTAYKNKWLLKFSALPPYWPTKDLSENFLESLQELPSLSKIGFEKATIHAPAYDLKQVRNYQEWRDFPARHSTTQIGHHLRFGSVSIRSLVYFAHAKNNVFLSELIWRDFFSQILYHFPSVVEHSFKPAYDRIEWENNPADFEKWCAGETGYPLVDAGMRQLNETGFMHNRVRMVVASFLVKHLLIDWRWGEAYFAEKLLDFDLASNNGNWQWAAGCGCDAAPYFRVFNPIIQQQKFDPDFKYIKHWIPNYNPATYRKPMVDHVYGRDRVIARFKKALTER